MCRPSASSLSLLRAPTPNLTHERVPAAPKLLRQVPGDRASAGLGEPQQLQPRRCVRAGPRRGTAALLSPPLPRSPGRWARGVRSNGPAASRASARWAGGRAEPSGPAGLAPSAARGTSFLRVAVLRGVRGEVRG